MQVNINRTVMTRLPIYIAFTIALFSCTNAQEKQDEQHHIAICEEKKGCEFAKVTLNASNVDELLRKKDFWTKASPNATLILVKCESLLDEERSLEEIHQAYGGKGAIKIKNKLDIEKHIKDNNCFQMLCPNKTKKISFSFKGEENNGTTFFYLNIQQDESFMPHEAFKMMGIPTVAEDGGEVSVNQFIKNKGFIDNYVIADGKKVHTQMDLRSVNPEQEKLNYQRFQKDFKKTGQERKFQNTPEVEYIGYDDEGRQISVWVAKSADVCVPPDKFSIVGFYNLGYFNIEGETYLITELSGSNFQLKVIGLTDAEYSFNTSGYTTY